MKRIVLTLLFALMAAGTTFADTIFYDTTPGSVFNCINSGSLAGCGTSQVTVGDTILLTYVPAVTSVDVFLPGTPSSNTQFGTLVVSCVDQTTSCALQTIAQGLLSLSVHIHQTGPDDVTGVIPDATLFGSIGGSSSSLLVQWNQGASVQMIGATFDSLYSIQNTTLGLVAPAAGGSTTIQSQIVASPGTVPEPAISLLFAGGLIALGAARRRK